MKTLEALEGLQGRAYGGQGDPSLGVEDVGPDNVISGGPPLQHGLVHVSTNKKCFSFDDCGFCL